MLKSTVDRFFSNSIELNRVFELIFLLMFIYTRQLKRKVQYRLNKRPDDVVDKKINHIWYVLININTFDIE